MIDKNDMLMCIFVNKTISSVKLEELKIFLKKLSSNANDLYHIKLILHLSEGMVYNLTLNERIALESLKTNIVDFLTKKKSEIDYLKLTNTVIPQELKKITDSVINSYTNLNAKYQLESEKSIKDILLNACREYVKSNTVVFHPECEKFYTNMSISKRYLELEKQNKIVFILSDNKSDPENGTEKFILTQIEIENKIQEQKKNRVEKLEKLEKLEASKKNKGKTDDAKNKKETEITVVDAENKNKVEPTVVDSNLINKNKVEPLVVDSSLVNKKPTVVAANLEKSIADSVKK